MPTIYVTELQHKQMVSPEEWHDYLKEKRAQRRKGEDMDYEYVALTWRTEEWIDDAQYVSDRGKLLRQGWQVHILAPWGAHKAIGGACIMRRPKDEPCMWTEGEIEAIFRTRSCRQRSTKWYS